METIWGKADSVRTVATGIVFVSTPSHGGYILSKERMDEMPEQYKVCSYTKNNCFEEDCSWCAVVLAFPQYFPAEQLEAAQQTYFYFYGPNRRFA